MKKLLITSLMLSSCACFACVSKGKGDTYMVDQQGTPINTTNPNERLPKRINFMPESEARQSSSFKCNSPMALY